MPALMRAVIIEVVHVLADHRLGVSFVVDQQAVGALLAKAAPPPFDETVRSRCPRRDLDHVDALGGEHLIECAAVLAVPITDEKSESVDPFTEVHDEVSGLLHDPGVVRVGGDPE